MGSAALSPFLALSAAFAVMVSLLGLRVSLRRVALGGISLGSGGDEDLRRRIRTHGNFVEYAPLQLFALLALGLSRTAPGIGWGFAAVFLLTRTAHAWSMGADSRNGLRAAAMVVQHLSMVCAAVLIIWQLAG